MISEKNKRRKRYDVTKILHVAFNYHLIVVTYLVANVGAKFDANHAKIALAVSNSFCI